MSVDLIYGIVALAIGTVTCYKASRRRGQKFWEYIDHNQNLSIIIFVVGLVMTIGQIIYLIFQYKFFAN